MGMKLHKKALWLSYLTVSYNLIEGIVSVVAGALAGSIALVGFGLDSFVESLSASVMIWRFSSGDHDDEHEERERTAVRLVGYTFFILAAYILYESVTTLYFKEIPEPSLLGIIIATISLIAMPALYYAKQKVGRSLGSRSLIADSKQTLACAFLSAALLIGLGANYIFDFWQADPLVGLLIVFFLVKEGYSALREGELCSC